MRCALSLLHPDIAGNVGTLIRTAACFDTDVHIVEPCGFPFGDRALRRAGMDYAEIARVQRHSDFAHFAAQMAGEGRRLVLLTTDGGTLLPEAIFTPADMLMLGCESSGAPAAAHDAAAMRVRIPLSATTRSLNVAVAGGIALAEALRQTRGFPT